ncbi:MAG TPA: metallophosphoesterase family protein [Thermoleophilaceae bacterium]|jgi:diadenosine tetraphosphatase ApaH/serine/threonine PP2A family protein phosphatase
MHAVLYDIHGNLPALDAVLADAAAAGAERFVLGGDYALFGAWPAETVERLRTLDAEWIRGNGERWTASPGDAPDNPVVQGAIRASRELLGAGAVAELAALPEEHALGEARFVHGSPVSDVRSFLPEPAGDEDELLAGVAADRLVFGHTHLQFRRRAARGIELINPGSVGMPFDGDPRAGYALLGDDGDVELRRVAYDQAASAAAVRERFPEFGETVARRIELAAFAA